MSIDTASTQIADDADYAAAVELAVTASAAYYGDGTSTLDDDAFDRLVRGIAAWEEAHPLDVLPGSPTGKVAGGLVIGDVPHTQPMLSLDNVFNAGQLADWAAGLDRRLGRPADGWAVEAKLDGLAIAARYRNGRLVQLVTRGDGTAGEDVSHAIGSIVGLPERLDQLVTVEVRGEVLLTRDQFEAANLLRVEHGGAPFANARSGAAGSLRAKDRPYQVEWTFFGYSALSLDQTSMFLREQLETRPHTGVMDIIAHLGIQTSAAAMPGTLRCATIEDVAARIEEIASARAALPFGIDGIVILSERILKKGWTELRSNVTNMCVTFFAPFAGQGLRAVQS